MKSYFKKNNNMKAFTLVELLLVIGIFSVLLTVTAGFIIMTLQSGSKSQAHIEVQEQARIAADRIAYEIRRASGIVSTSSYTNLALNPALSFGLVSTSSPTRSPIIFSVLNGILNK